MARQHRELQDRELKALEERIGHVFTDDKLIAAALTHVSAVTGRKRETYQRLEFLGDRVLGLAVSEMLYEAFPTADEGELSRRLAALVRKESCAEVALAWGIETHIRLGDGEKHAGAANMAILGDVCESIIGAVFLDAGYSTAKTVVAAAFGARMLSPEHRCAIRRHCCKSGRKGAAFRRRSIARPRDPAPTTRRNLPFPLKCRAIRMPRREALRNASPSKRRRRRSSHARASAKRAPREQQPGR